jgi:HEAT repeat protein
MLLWKKLQMSMSGPEARLDAIRQLSQSKDPAAVDILIEALKDRDGQVPVLACAALAHLGNPKAVPALAALLRDKDEYVRGPASEALADIGQPAVGAVVALLSYTDPKVRELATQTLGKIGIAALGPLTTTLRSTDVRLRTAAATALGQIDHPRSIDMLLGALKDKDLGVIDQAGRSLVKIGKSAVPGLLNLLNDPKEDMRQRALGILQKLGAEPMTETYIRPVAHGKWHDVADVRSTALDALLAALKDPDREKRSTAILTLANIGDARAVPGLTQALADSDRELREAAAKALVKIKGAAVDHLLTTLKSGPTELRRYTALVLGYIRDGRAVEPLIAALADREGVVRGEAAEALAGFKDPRSVEPLLNLLRDPQPLVRFSVVGTLWRLGDPQAIDGLVGALKDTDPATRKRAAQGVGDIADKRAIEPLVRLFNEDKAARLEAALAVAKIDPPRSVSLLLQVAKDDVMESSEAVAILADVLEVAAPRLKLDDLQAIADLPAALEARQRSGSSSLQTKVDTSTVLKRGNDELSRRGKATNPSGGIEKRVYPRRPVNNAPVLIVFSQHQTKPDNGSVVDISSRGLGIMANRAYTVGAALTVKHAQAAEDDPWIVAEVRHCTKTAKGWKVGCKCVQRMPEEVIALFK